MKMYLLQSLSLFLSFPLCMDINVGKYYVYAYMYIHLCMHTYVNDKICHQNQSTPSIRMICGQMAFLIDMYHEFVG